jgi:hypothetical protein
MRLIARILLGSGTVGVSILSLLIPKARFDSELLKTSREMLAVSLRTPRNNAELSSASEEVPLAENVPNKLLARSKAEIKALNWNVSSTAICAPAAETGVSKVIVSGPGFPGDGKRPGLNPVNKMKSPLAKLVGIIGEVWKINGGVIDGEEVGGILTFNPKPLSDVTENELGKNVKGGVVTKLPQSMRSLSSSAVRLVIKDKAKLGEGNVMSKAVRATPRNLGDRIFIIQFFRRLLFYLLVRRPLYLISSSLFGKISASSSYNTSSILGITSAANCGKDSARSGIDVS